MQCAVLTRDDDDDLRKGFFKVVSKLKTWSFSRRGLMGLKLARDKYSQGPGTSIAKGQE